MTEKPNVKPYPVGSVVVLVSCEIFPELVGKEMTLTTSLLLWEDERYGAWWGYGTDFKTPSNSTLVPFHEHIRLKRLPPEQDQWCRDVLSRVLDDAPLSSKGDILIVPEEDKMKELNK